MQLETGATFKTQGFEGIRQLAEKGSCMKRFIVLAGITALIFGIAGSRIAHADSITDFAVPNIATDNLTIEDPCDSNSDCEQPATDDPCETNNDCEEPEVVSDPEVKLIPALTVRRNVSRLANTGPREVKMLVIFSLSLVLITIGVGLRTKTYKL